MVGSGWWWLVVVVSSGVKREACGWLNFKTNPLFIVVGLLSWQQNSCHFWNVFVVQSGVYDVTRLWLVTVVDKGRL